CYGRTSRHHNATVPLAAPLKAGLQAAPMWNSHAAIQLLQPLVGTGAIEKNPTKEASVSLHPYAGGPVISVGAIRSMLGLAAVGPRDERGGRGDDTREATMLFSERSLWTMIHGIALGGGSLLALAAALFALYLLSPRERSEEHTSE